MERKVYTEEDKKGWPSAELSLFQSNILKDPNFVAYSAGEDTGFTCPTCNMPAYLSKDNGYAIDGTPLESHKIQHTTGAKDAKKKTCYKIVMVGSLKREKPVPLTKREEFELERKREKALMDSMYDRVAQMEALVMKLTGGQLPVVAVNAEEPVAKLQKCPGVASVADAQKQLWAMRKTDPAMLE